MYRNRLRLFGGINLSTNVHCNVSILCGIETSIMLNIRLRIKLIINLLENSNTSTMASSYIYIATQMENYSTPLLRHCSCISAFDT